jgi:sortase A
VLNVMRLVRKLEALLLVCGIVMLAVYVSALIHGTLFSQIELRKFMQVRESATRSSPVLPEETNPPDFTLWSKARIAAYAQSLIAKTDAPLAVLQIRKIKLTVPLLEGTDELVLNRGVGHIDGTAAPGKEGNIGIAGHRDGFFRGLKDIEVGDEVDLLLPKGTDKFVVDQVVIVDPSEVSVLRAGTKPALTLVTCYPFYFVGSAPQRYIVHAVIVSGPAGSGAGGQGVTSDVGEDPPGDHH